MSILPTTQPVCPSFIHWIACLSICLSASHPTVHLTRQPALHPSIYSSFHPPCMHSSIHCLIFSHLIFFIQSTVNCLKADTTARWTPTLSGRGCLASPSCISLVSLQLNPLLDWHLSEESLSRVSALERIHCVCSFLCRYMMLILKEREIYLIDRDNNVFAAPQFHFPQRKILKEHIYDTLIDGVRENRHY